MGNGGGRKKPTIVALARKLLVAPWKYVTAVTSPDASRAVFAGFFRCLGVPSVWIRAVMRVESDGQTMQNGVPITSPAGAMGLMQLMPDTYADMQTRYGLGNDPYDPQDNIAAGAAFLHEMYLRYGCPDLFAAYNAGPARFDHYLYDGVSLPAETVAYLEAMGQLQFGMPQPGDLAAGNGKNFMGRSVGVVGKAASNLALEAPGMAGLMPSSHGLFVALQTQSSDQP